MQGITVNTIVDFGSEYDNRNRKRAKDEEKDRVDKGRLPRITRLMALAIYLQEMIEKGKIKTTCLDDMDITPSLIYLDIEGSEYDALMGASETIRRSLPVIGMEDKGWNSRYNHGASPVDLLKSRFDYKVLCKPFASDIILVPC